MRLAIGVVKQTFEGFRGDFLLTGRLGSFVRHWLVKHPLELVADSGHQVDLQLSDRVLELDVAAVGKFFAEAGLVFLRDGNSVQLANLEEN